MSKFTVLIPYNFTRNDQKALDFVKNLFADRPNTEITLFNAYVPVPAVEVRGSPIMDKVDQNLTFLSQKIREQEQALETAKQFLVNAGFTEKQVHTVFEPKKKDVAGSIINQAITGKYNVVVLNRKFGKIGRFFTGSVFNKVTVGLQNTTICIVS
ncbi:MAG: universal stress protein [Desulfobacterales bacterium]|nr:universal stress protein [Desulfobacterales bacterium]